MTFCRSRLNHFFDYNINDETVPKITDVIVLFKPKLTFNFINCLRMKNKAISLKHFQIVTNILFSIL